MPRRVNLPGARDLYRTTGADETDAFSSVEATSLINPPEVKPSRRVRHDEKITVYLSSDELMALERARLEIRRGGVNIDRGRIVREAVAMALEGLSTQGRGSQLFLRISDDTSRG